MTTTAQLVSAAEAANWSSFKSLVLSASPADIAAIGSDWNTVMDAVGYGVSNGAVASKSLFTSAMTAFFGAASPYLAGDTVVQALDNIAQNSFNLDVDHLSVEMVAIMNAVPAAVASTATTFPLNSLMFDISFNQFNSQVTPTDVKNTYAALTAKFGAQLDVNTVMSTVSQLADNNAFPPVDQLGAVRVLLAAEPANKAEVDPFSLRSALDSIVRNEGNTEVTATELNNTFKAFVEGYGSLTDVNAILFAAGHLAGNDPNIGTDHLASVRTLLLAEPANKAEADPYQLRSVLDSITMDQFFSPTLGAQELNGVFAAFVSTYGAQTDVNAILHTAARVAETDAQLGAGDHLSSVRTLLAAEPDNKASADPFEVNEVLGRLVQDVTFNLSVPAGEFDKTIASFAAHYGTVADVNVLLSSAGQIAGVDAGFNTDHFDAVRTLLSVHPDNAAMADPSTASFTLQQINSNLFNPVIGEEELAQTLSKFMTTYGAFAFTQDLSFAIRDDAEAGKFEAAGAIVNHLTAAQFTDAAADANVFGFSTVGLLTTGNDSFNGATSDKLAVFGGAGRDSIDFSGNATVDSRYLDGGAGRDTLTGGLGDDLLNGGAGADTLTGGSGADTFRFDRTSGAPDHVTDFSASGGDRIDLHDVLGTEAGLAISDYVSLQTVGANTIVSVDTDGAGTAHGFVQVAQLDNTTGLDVDTLYANGQIIV